jgi:multidrug efflux pump subunit AcrA (membrane-fusion protein)
MLAKKKLAWLVLAVFAGLAGIAAGLVQWQGVALAQTPSASTPVGPVIRVKTIRPRTGSDLEVGVEQPADVAPYYRVELQSQVAGTLKFLEKDIGDKVAAGERLAEIEPVEGAGDGKAKGVVTAPFDGVIARRSADPGTFVANPAIVSGVSPLLVVERTDIVTISMRVPEAYVAQVGKDTEAELRLDAMPGKVLRFKPTRLAPSLDPADRTLVLEVDLYNGTAEEHRQFLERAKLSRNADLKGRTLPEFPKGLEVGAAARLLPGMYGKMRLRLRRFQNAPVIPSSAIVRRGGLAYLFLVESDVARLRPIAVELDDGLLSRVFWLDKEGGRDVRRELAREEDLVLTNQGELEDGSRVLSTRVE